MRRLEIKEIPEIALPIDKWGLRTAKVEVKRERTIEDVPNQDLTEWSIKLFLLMNLTWGYIDTICDLCSQMKFVEVKKHCREIKEWKRKYYQFRQSFYSTNDERNETDRGEWFEETFSSDFDKLFNGIYNLAAVVGKDNNHRLLFVAVQQALTLIDTVTKYARYCDQRIRGYDVWVCDCCMVQTEFLKAVEIVRKFPCAKDERFVPLRELSSRVMYNRLKEMEVWETKDGQVKMKAVV